MTLDLFKNPERDQIPDLVEIKIVDAGTSLLTTLDQKKLLEAEMKQNGQTYYDQEEEEEEDMLLKLEMDKCTADIVDNELLTGTAWTKHLLCGYCWRQIKWTNVVWLSVLHVLFVFAYAYCFVSPVKLFSVLWTVFLTIFSGFGMSVGAHRLWAHQSFCATTLLSVILLVLQTMTVNGSAFSYARDHRNHHKWPGTHADPKNPNRGFFFAHIGWWMLRKRSEVAKFGKKVPMQYLLDDWLLMLQHRCYIPLVVLLAFKLPIAIPVLLWQEQILTSAALCVIRIVIVQHHLFSVNSVAHFWGYRPYNRFLKPAENHFINWISMGEGQHNYHHTFPFDYRSSEYFWWEVFNPSSLFIETCIFLGLAYKPKKASVKLIRRVIENKGEPKYFVDIYHRSFCWRILLGLLDWALAMLFVQWPIWFVLTFKVFTGRLVFVF